MLLLGVGYTKLFDRLVRSSIWDEDAETCKVWITMLALSDKDGNVISTVKSLALMSRVGVEKTVEALAKFLAPDPEGLTQEHEGRRLSLIEGGWHLLNHSKYRQMLRNAERGEYKRDWMAKARAKAKRNKGKPLAGEALYERTGTDAFEGGTA